MASGYAAAWPAKAVTRSSAPAATLRRRVAQPHPKQRGHLIISRPASPQTTPQVGADPVDQPALQRGMHILVGDQRPETAVGDIFGQAVQASQQPVALIFGQQPGIEQHLGVRAGGGDVVRRQYPVEMGRPAQCAQRGGRAVGEPSTPQRTLVGAHVSSAARSRRAASLDDSPCTWTKPLAIDWSKVSPSS